MLNDLNDGQEERDDNETHDNREEYDHDGLDDRSDPSHGIVYVFVVVIRHSIKHLSKLTRLFTHVDHTGDHIGKDRLA